MFGATFYKIVSAFSIDSKCYKMKFDEVNIKADISHLKKCPYLFHSSDVRQNS